MKQNNTQKKYKEFLELLIGFKLKQSMMGQEDFNNKIKKQKNNFNLEEGNSL
jgi:hypothetical protein